MKILTLILLLIFPTLSFAVIIENPDGVFNKCNDQYSFKDFTNKNLQDINIPSGTVICRSNFSQEVPDSHIFSESMNGVVFIEGNLDNVFIPVGNVVVGASQSRFATQNDLRKWFVDKNNNPVKLVDEQIWVAKDISVNPVDIPTQKIIVSSGQDAEIVLSETLPTTKDIAQ